MLKRDLPELCLLRLTAGGDPYGCGLPRRLHDVRKSAIYNREE